MVAQTNAGLMKENKHRIVKVKSCLTNLLEFIKEVTERADDVDMLYMDFQKVFGVLPNGPVRKGVKEKVATWIQDWRMTGNTK